MGHLNMHRSLISFVFGACLCFGAPAAYAQQQVGQDVSKELMQYVRDARKAGIKEGQIQQNAIAAGWPETMVTAALREAVNTNPAGNVMPTAGNGATAEAPKSDAIHPADSTAGSNNPSVVVTSAHTDKSPDAGTASAIDTGAENKSPNPKGDVKPATIDRRVPDEYEIGAGDELQISVWKEPDASVPAAVVRPDGKISMPMLKEVSVVGLTPVQAEKQITEQLAKFITAADVTVIVKGINSKKIYVVGGVKKEGPIPYTYRMTVLQALSEAGGLTDYAKKKRIYVLHHEGGRDFRYPFDYDAVLRGEKMELNIPLMPGDTLVVPK